MRQLALGFVISTSLLAKAPTLTHVFPAGALRGSTVEVTLGGYTAEEKTQAWTSHPSLSLTAFQKDKAQLKVAADAPLGLHWLRLYNSAGASEARLLSVGALNETKEVEPNDALSAPMPVDHLPVCMNGTLEKGGAVDLFSLQLEAGSTLTALLEAYCLGSAADAFLELRGPAGEIVATAHDARSLDPVLALKIEKTGRHILQVAGFAHPPSASVNFTGGASVIYRLHLTTQPVTSLVYPPVVSRKEKTVITFSGTLPLPEKDRSTLQDASTFPSEPPVQSLSHSAALTPLPVLVTSEKVLTETEPNDAKEKAQPLALGTMIAGRIDRAGDEDSYLVTVKKGQYYNFRVHAKDLLLPLDAKLTLRSMQDDSLLRELDDADDKALPDPLLAWKSTLDGPVRITVADLFEKGGPSSIYVLHAAPGYEPLEAEISSGTSLTLAPGATAEIKAKLSARFDFSGKLSARVQQLPHGITADPVEVKPKNGTEFTVKLVAASNAQPWSGPIHLSLWATYPEAPPTTVKAHTRVRGEAERGITQQDVLDHVWLTVLPAK